MPLITDQMVQAAFDWLNEQVQHAASAKADRIRAEYATKQAKANAFLDAEGTVAERDAKAVASNVFHAAVEKETKAIAKDEFFRNQRDKCTAIIEAWRTQSSNYRALGKVG